MLSQAILDPGRRDRLRLAVVPELRDLRAQAGRRRRRSCRSSTTATTSMRSSRPSTPRTKLVYICHPNNPTGTMNTADELDAYFERVPDHVLTVVDQAYFEYIDRPDYPDAVERYLKAGRRVAVLRTFSKIYGLAGLRVGYAVASAAVCAAMAKVRRPVRPDDAGAGRGAREHRRRPARSRAGARSTPQGLARLESLLREHGLEPVPSVGNFLYVDTGDGRRRALRAAAARGGDRPAARRASARRRRSGSRSARPRSSTCSRTRSVGCWRRA